MFRPIRTSRVETVSKPLKDVIIITKIVDGGLA